MYKMQALKILFKKKKSESVCRMYTYFYSGIQNLGRYHTCDTVKSIEYPATRIINTSKKLVESPGTGTRRLMVTNYFKFRENYVFKYITTFLFPPT